MQEREERWICQDYLVGTQHYWEAVCLGRVRKGCFLASGTGRLNRVQHPRNHSHAPHQKEKAGDYFNCCLSLSPLRGLFLLVKEKVKVERQKIVPEFKRLRQYLEQQECLLLARLGELEKQIETRLKENAAKFSKRIIYLDGLIKEKEHQLPGRKSPQVRSAGNST